jgi:hypothetical protein
MMAYSRLVRLRLQFRHLYLNYPQQHDALPLLLA